jgi:hypothetical protein
MRLSMVGTTMACVTLSSLTSRTQARGSNAASSGVDRAENPADPGDVVRRHADQRRIPRLSAEELHGADDVSRELTVAQDRRLRRAGRPAGEQQRGDVLRSRDQGRRVRHAVAHLAEELFTGRYRESLGERHGQRRIRGGDQDTLAEPLEHGVQLIGGEPVADRHECLSGERRAEQQQRDSR